MSRLLILKTIVFSILVASLGFSQFAYSADARATKIIEFMKSEEMSGLIKSENGNLDQYSAHFNDYFAKLIPSIAEDSSTASIENLNKFLKLGTRQVSLLVFVALYLGYPTPKIVGVSVPPSFPPLTPAGLMAGLSVKYLIGALGTKIFWAGSMGAERVYANRLDRLIFSLPKLIAESEHLPLEKLTTLNHKFTLAILDSSLKTYPSNILNGLLAEKDAYEFPIEQCDGDESL